MIGTLLIAILFAAFYVLILCVIYSMADSPECLICWNTTFDGVSSYMRPPCETCSKRKLKCDGKEKDDFQERSKS